MLTHLDPNMVKFLHAQELSQIRLSLFFVILQIVDVLEAEILKFLFESLYHILELLHGIGMLLHKLLDRLRLEVELHLNWSEILSDNITNHFASNVVELVIKVCFFKLNDPDIHLLNFLMAVF